MRIKNGDKNINGITDNNKTKTKTEAESDKIELQNTEEINEIIALTECQETKDENAGDEHEIELNGEDDDCVRVEAQSWVERMFWRLHFDQLFRNNIIAIIITLIAFILFGLSIWASILIEDEMDVGQSRLLLFPSDSKMNDFQDDLNSMFPTKFETDSHFMIQNIDISDKLQRDKVINYTQDLNDMDPEYIITNIDEWITRYDLWLQSEYNITMDDISGDNQRFYDLLRDGFLNEYKVYKSTIIFEENMDNMTSIYSTKFMRFSYATTPINQYYSLESEYRNIGEENELDTLYFDEFMVYGNLANTQQNRIWTVFGWSILVIFLVELMFATPLILFLVIIGILMINITLFGWMYINDIIMSPINFTLFTFAVGLTSNYMIYTTHHLIQYLKQKEINLNHKNEKYWNKRIDFLLISIQKYYLLGFITTFVSIIPIGFTDVEEFYNVFVMMTGLMFITCLYNLLFMPVITVWLLPILQYCGDKIQDYMDKPKKKKHCCGWVCTCGCPCKCNKEFKRAGCCKWDTIHKAVASQDDYQQNQD